MYRRIILIACLTFLFSLRAAAQPRDTIFLMNGHIVAQKVIDTLLGAVTINNPDKYFEKIHFEPEQLYMVRYLNGFKRYYYFQDSTVGNWFTRQEMWMYMKGERDARKGFRARGALIGSTIVGFAGGLTGTIWGPAAPYGYMALSGMPKVRISHSTVSDPRNLESDAYILGYERVARQKMKMRSLLGGTIGLVAGYCFYAVFHNRYPESLNIGLSD
jgi:hypothetical protein